MKEFKPNVLKKLMEDEIDEIRDSSHLVRSVFAIYIEDGIEVQIMVTRAEEDIIGEVYPLYAVTEEK